MIRTNALRISPLLGQPGFLRLALAVVLFNAGYSIYIFLFNFFLESQQQHESRMGALTGAMVLGGALGALPVGRLANRLGSVRTLAMSLAGAGILLGLRLLPVGFLLQWLLAAASGVFLAGWTVLIFPLIAGLVPQDRRDGAFQIFYGLATGAGCLGAIVGGNFPSLCARFLPMLLLTNRERLGLLAAAALVCLSAFSLPRMQTAEPETALLPLRPSRRLTGLLTLSAWWAFLLGAINPFSGIYFLNQFHMQVSAIGWYFFVVQAVVALGLLAAGASRLSSLPAWKLFLGAQLLVALSILGLGTRLLWFAQAAYLLFMLAQQFSQPAMQSLLLHRASQTARNSIAGWNTLFATLAQSISAPVFGLLWAHWGYSAVLPLLALLTFLTTAAVAAIPMSWAHPSPDHAPNRISEEYPQ